MGLEFKKRAHELAIKQLISMAAKETLTFGFEKLCNVFYIYKRDDWLTL